MAGIQLSPLYAKQIDLAEPAISVQRLFMQFGDNVVLNDFSLTVNRNENVVILGKSGAGKSVLIKCIIGLLKPDKGSIRIYGDEILNLSQHEMDRVRIKIGFLFQGNAIYDSMSVRENLEFPLRRHWFTITQNDVNDMVMEALENVGLSKAVEMMPSELSGGMLKRVALARTMILRPEIILYDEPTSGLDPVTAREIDNLIVQLHEKYHTAAVIISHDMNSVKLTANRVILLLEGKCYTEGTYTTLERSEDKNIKQFFE